MLIAKHRIHLGRDKIVEPNERFEAPDPKTEAFLLKENAAVRTDESDAAATPDSATKSARKKAALVAEDGL